MLIVFSEESTAVVGLVRIVVIFVLHDKAPHG